jgi:hypothetical protein
MSQDAVARFLELVSSESEIEDEMNTAAERQEDVAAVAVTLGRQHGLEFSREEFASVVESFHRAYSGALDDAELEGVSGGFTPQPEPPGIFDTPADNPWFSQPWSSNFNWGP